MKYVIIRCKVGNNLHRNIPVIFSNDLSHIDVVKAITGACSEAENGVAVSAGELNSFDLNTIRPTGHSVTLKLTSHKDEDLRIITMCDYGAHIE